MKITGIDIGEYRQFKNIKFDFTYPADHKKAGRPLEKVCFIGQSGTGKTTLLNLFFSVFEIINDGYDLLDGKGFSYSSLHNYVTFKNKINVRISINDKSVNFSNELIDVDIPVGSSLIRWINNDNGIYEDLRRNDKFTLFIRDYISREADAFLSDQKGQPQTFSDFVKTDGQVEKEKNARGERIDSASSKKVVSLGDMQSLSIWQYLLQEINQYDEETVQQVTKIIQNTQENFKLTEELQKWIDADPRIKLAKECLNPILSELFLEVDISAKGSIPVTLCTKQGIKIDNSHLSTGTRQLLTTAIPIYKFDTTDTVILFDEPERSLYPDIQQGLVKYYTSLAPKAQFFFATHSPFVASAFEPCERFILYFDENGEVKFHNGVAPEGDDPNDILRQDFGMEYLMLQKGLEAYEEYRRLAMQIRAETDEEKKNQLIVERLELGNRYNFAGQYAQSK